MEATQIAQRQDGSIYKSHCSRIFATRLTHSLASSRPIRDLVKDKTVFFDGNADVIQRERQCRCCRSYARQPGVNEDSTGLKGTLRMNKKGTREIAPNESPFSNYSKFNQKKLLGDTDRYAGTVHA